MSNSVLINPFSLALLKALLKKFEDSFTGVHITLCSDDLKELPENWQALVQELFSDWDIQFSDPDDQESIQMHFDNKAYPAEIYHFGCTDKPELETPEDFLE